MSPDISPFPASEASSSSTIAAVAGRIRTWFFEGPFLPHQIFCWYVRVSQVLLQLGTRKLVRDNQYSKQRFLLFKLIIAVSVLFLA